MDNTVSKISEKIKKGGEVSPFLFIGKNLDLLNEKVENIAISLLNEFEIPNVYLYILKDDGEKIKIKEIKSFVEYSNSKSPFKFQIFFIENISRLTPTSSNSLLKFFEEPGVGNIIFTTNSGENNILETIISRVQIIDLNISQIKKENAFYLSLIKNYLKEESNEIIAYFFKSKLEKQEYIDFLENLIIYSKNNLTFINYLEEINEDINSIKQNNLNAKYIVDKWILKIK
ncbi:MAG: hypothetical protein PHV23_02190 [Candidatus Gracilibacteria bacterium]|nr:hypothetical protein [Candidatus Gracilibacteria bacterium]